MNLLDKNWSGLLIVAALAIFSCEDANDIGLGLDPDGINVSVLYTELPLTATNVRIDSIRTSRDSRILIGKHSDATFGTTTATGLSRLAFTAALPSDTTYSSDPEEFGEEVYILDSVVLRLDVKKVHSNNINPVQKFQVFQLEDTLQSTAYYLSDFHTPYNTSNLLGEFSFKLSSFRIDALELDSTYLLSYRLSDEMGQEILDIAKSQTSIDKGNSTLWYDYKGIAIVPDAANTALIGVSPVDSTSLEVHYHIVDYFYEDAQKTIVKSTLYEDSLSLNLSLSTGNAYYSKIETDRSGSLMAAETGDYNSFKTGDGYIYLQPSSGIFPKLDLDTLTQFLNSPENSNIQINRMEFALETFKNGSYFSNVPNVRYMFIEGDDGSKINVKGITTNNVVSTAIMTDAAYSTQGGAEYLTAVLDDTDDTMPMYGGVPTIFAQLVESEVLTLDHLILLPTDITTPDFSIFDEETGFKVKLYYTLPE